MDDEESRFEEAINRLAVAGVIAGCDDDRFEAVVKFGLQINQFTWPGGAAAIGPTLARVARTADDVGFDSIWVMDHFFQIRGLGPPEAPMLEGQTALGFIAANTERARIGLMVGGIHYRSPGLWVKATTTLDVLSGGRAWFGIGAAWNVHESKGLGFAFPPLKERFEWLEDTLQFAHEMWSEGSGTHGEFAGTHLWPRTSSTPRSRSAARGSRSSSAVGASGRPCDWSPSTPTPATSSGARRSSSRAKLEVLREHCERLGRPYDEIERTVLTGIDLDTDSTDATVQRFGELGEAGAQHLIFSVRGVADTSRLERIGSEVIAQLR